MRVDEVISGAVGNGQTRSARVRSEDCRDTKGRNPSPRGEFAARRCAGVVGDREGVVSRENCRRPSGMDRRGGVTSPW